MNKTFGLKSEFVYVFEDTSRVVVCYDYEEVDDVHATWREVVFYKKQGIPTVEKVQEAIIANINARTDEKILSGYQWKVLHGESAGKTVNVWLSQENRENFKAKHDAAKAYPELIEWPMKYKISEDEDGAPIYEHFQSIEELAQFYLGGIAFIEQCINDGWAEKDGMDWTVYEVLNAQPEVIVEE